MAGLGEQQTEPVDTVSMAVVGVVGHGKSTVLNLMSGQENEEFTTGSGLDSVTKEIAWKGFDVLTPNDAGSQIKLWLLDTMGFPDPNPKHAIPFYDQVVQECNKPLNAIVWVAKLDRGHLHLLKSYAVLLREFQHAAPPLIILVNNFGNFWGVSEDEQKRRRLDAMTQGRAFGKVIAEHAGVTPLKIIVCPEVKDLKGRVKAELIATLQGTAPLPSTMRNAETLMTDLNLCETEEEQAKLERTEIEKRVQKLEKNILRIKSEINGQKSKLDEKRRSAWTLWMKEGYVHDRDAIDQHVKYMTTEMSELSAQLDQDNQTQQEEQQKKAKRIAMTLAMKRQLEELMSALTGPSSSSGI